MPKSQFTISDFDLHDVLEEVLRLYRFMAQTQDVVLTVAVQREVPPALKGDADVLRSTLTELVGQAVREGAQGIIEIQVGCVDESGHLLNFRVTEKHEFSMAFKPADVTGSEVQEFDEQQLDKLAGHESGGRPIMNLLTEDFCVYGGQVIIAMKAAAHDGNLEEFKDFAEALSSPSMTLGLQRLSKFVASIEQMTEADDTILLEKIHQLEALYLSASSWLRSQTKSSKAS